MVPQPGTAKRWISFEWEKMITAARNIVNIVSNVSGSRADDADGATEVESCGQPGPNIS